MVMVSYRYKEMEMEMKPYLKSTVLSKSQDQTFPCYLQSLVGVLSGDIKSSLTGKLQFERCLENATYAAVVIMAELQRISRLANTTRTLSTVIEPLIRPAIPVIVISKYLVHRWVVYYR
jgi:hypothetical protein